GGISGAAAGHQNAVGIPDISGLQHLRYDCRLDQEAPYRAAFTDLDIEVEIGQRALTLRDKNLPRHREHRIDNSEIGDVAGTNLAIDHIPARGRKIGHYKPWKSGGALPPGG